jgi:16S rRNA (uracil1498-N3)-methyltransferase
MYRLVIAPTQQQNEWLNLTSQQQHYLKRVLRLKNGDQFVAMDGKRQAWQAQLEDMRAKLLAPLLESTELPLNLTLMVALPKGSGFDEIVRCCTELGVTAFMPVISKRTLLKPSSQKLERWRKIAIEAAEQSERQTVPPIHEPVDLATALTKVNKIDAHGYICVTRKESNHLLTHLPQSISKNLIIVTGPEGGWTPDEVEQAIAVDFQPVSLGSRILRAITAPIVAVALTTALIETQTFSD